MSGIKASRGQCPFSGPSPPQSQQTGALLESPSTWLKLFDLPWRSPETLPHTTYRSMQAGFPYEWLVLTHASQFPNPFKQQLASVSPRPGTSSNQPGFARESPSPIQVEAISECFVTQAGWSRGKTPMGSDFGLHHLETPRPAHPRDSYRPCQITI